MNLPASVQEIIEVIGVSETAHLIKNLPTYRENMGGRAVERVILYVPKSVGPGHRLDNILGLETAQKLCAGFGGETLKPANANCIERWERNTKILRMANEGVPSRIIARSFDLTDRQIRNIVRRSGNGWGELRGANDL